jgi:cell division protein FtsB
MAVKQKNTKRKEKRLQANADFLSATNRLIFSLLSAVLAVGAFFIYVPEKVKLGKLKNELQLAKLREEKASGQLEYLEIKLDALKNDPTFLEIQSRDRLQLYRPGETIFRIERE